MTDEATAANKALMDEIAGLRAEISELKMQVESARAGTFDAAAGDDDTTLNSRAQQFKTAADDSVHALVETLSRHIEEKPLQSAIIAFLLGALLSPRGHK